MKKQKKPATKTQKRNDRNWKKLLIIYISVAVILYGLIVMRKPNIQSTQYPTPSISQTDLETANWNSYENTKFGYAFRHPASLKVDKNVNDDTSLNEAISITMYDPNKHDGSNIDFFYVNLSEDNRTLDEIKNNLEKDFTITKSYPKYGKSRSLKNITFGGKPALAYEDNITKTINVLNNGFLYNIRFDKNKPILNKVLLTFKFIDPEPTATIQGWKVYRNNVTGYTIEYPGNWVKSHFDSYVQIFNVKNDEYFMPIDYVYLRIFVSPPEEHLGPDFKNISEQEFYNIKGSHWKNACSAGPQFHYGNPQIINLKEKGIFQTCRPTINYEGSTTDQISYYYHFWKKDKVVSVMFVINEKNPDFNNAIAIKDQMMSTFKFVD